MARLGRNRRQNASGPKQSCAQLLLSLALSRSGTSWSNGRCRRRSRCKFKTHFSRQLKKALVPASPNSQSKFLDPRLVRGDCRQDREAEPHREVAGDSCAF
jgi:hypothetical protein